MMIGDQVYCLYHEKWYPGAIVRLTTSDNIYIVTFPAGGTSAFYRFEIHTLEEHALYLLTL